MSMAIAESAAAAQKLRREAEKGIRFRRSAGRVVQARRVVKGMNIGKKLILLYDLFFFCNFVMTNVLQIFYYIYYRRC